MIYFGWAACLAVALVILGTFVVVDGLPRKLGPFVYGGIGASMLAGLSLRNTFPIISVIAWGFHP